MVFGAGSLWLADGAAGSVTRIDALTLEATPYPVGGIVPDIAVDPDTATTAYALTTAEVIPVIRRAGALAVSTGPCVSH